jgi:hypothetical protein
VFKISPTTGFDPADRPVATPITQSRPMLTGVICIDIFVEFIRSRFLGPIFLRNMSMFINLHYVTSPPPPQPSTFYRLFNLLLTAVIC